jgi:asparagine synthase (glutamine-hydrolysing)
MCGIFGILFKNRQAIPETEKMETSIQLFKHRGPDDKGYFIDSGIGLGHVRLSLLDLSERGKQPFWSDDGRYCIVYNGEVYNFKGLRIELEELGYTFKSTTDTEVVLKCFIEFKPEEAFKKLKGMFAFALYDTIEKKLLIVRDRYGIKPLYVYNDDNAFAFSSEIEALKPWIKLEDDPHNIISFMLGFEFPTLNSCYFKNLQTLAPGTITTIKIGEEPKFQRAYKLTDMMDPAESEKLDSMTAIQSVDYLDALLTEAVKQMLFADAEVGALCSGGVDSSIIMAIAAKQHDNLAIFHADVKGPNSEYDAAKTLADHLNLDLRSTEVTDQDFIDLMPEVTFHYGHPFIYHPNSIPFLMVTKLVKKFNVKAVLSGEGADECFLGYQGIAQEPFLKFYKRQILKLASMIKKIPQFGHYLYFGSDGNADLVRGMLNKFECEIEYQEIDNEYKRIKKDLDLNVRSLHWLAYHLRTLLHRNDCLGMASSIEARFPFLDEDVVKAAINLPHNRKIRFSITTFEKSHPLLRDKWIVRKLADRYIPKKLSRRRKLGFPTTAIKRMNISKSYFRNSFVEEYLTLSRPVLNYLYEHSNQTMKLRLLFLDVWGQVCLNSSSIESVKEKLTSHISFH